MNVLTESSLVDRAPTRRWDDARLVAACLDGDERAWAALIGKYKNLIYSIPLKYRATPEDAADVFQAVCVDLFNELPRLRNADSIKSWLATVASHHSYHWKKKSIRRSEREVPTDDPEPLAATLPVDALEVLEEEQAVREAIDGLPERCQRLVRLLFYEDPPLPYQVVAARLGLAVGSIGFIRGRCLKKLGALLTPARG